VGGDPGATPAAPRRFAPGYGRLLLLTYAPALAAVSAGALAAGAFDPRAALVAALAGPAALLPLLFVVRRWLAVEVGPAGIVASDPWGRRRAAGWDELEGAAPLRLPGLPFARVARRGGAWRLWVPLAVADPGALRAAVAAHAPAGCPLRRLLLAGGSAAR